MNWTEKKLTEPGDYFETMRIKQINRIQIDLDRDGFYRCRIRRPGAVTTVYVLEEFRSLKKAEEFCRGTLDFVKRAQP